MKKEAMSEGQSLGLEEQLRSLSPIISAVMENKAVINLTIYAGNIGQKIDHATQGWPRGQVSESWYLSHTQAPVPVTSSNRTRDLPLQGRMALI
jgi:hypothetical protein